MSQVDQVKPQLVAVDQIPELFRNLPILEDPLQTETSEAQLETLQDVLPYILGIEGGPRELNSHGIPKIRRDKHVEFLRKKLEKMPPAFTAYDAARPWILYWTLTALSLLGQDISEYRERVISTLSAAQNQTGGFGGGNGQLSHIAPTFAAVLSLAMVGGHAAFNLIDRRAMWEWLGQVKDPSGGFRMAIGAELDARGVYCAMVIISLLDLPLDLPVDAPSRKNGFESFLDQIPEWISQCQSYEGGLSARPNGEAHAAYTFCGLACLSIIGQPKEILNRWLDIPLLISWLSARQNAPEGGFSGRTNKLVDSCYSHWVGGCHTFVQQTFATAHHTWNEEGIIRYILYAAQHETGGMRDKPFKQPDGYHSCYALAGLSAMQFNHAFSASSSEQPNALESAFGWRLNGSATSDQFFDEDDLLEPMHPIYTIPYAAVESFQSLAAEKTGF